MSEEAKLGKRLEAILRICEMATAFRGMSGELAYLRGAIEAIQLITRVKEQ